MIGKVVAEEVLQPVKVNLKMDTGSREGEIKFLIAPNWYIYTDKIDGDLGRPTTIKLSVPNGVTVSPLVWPKGKSKKVNAILGDSSVEVLEGQSEVRFNFTMSDMVKSGAAAVAKITWLACSETVCMPGKAEIREKL
jgi:DsbC/DsbD-like thiol-disulfide interchange protein